MSRLTFTKSFYCTVVSETVSIKLARRLPFGGRQDLVLDRRASDRARRPIGAAASLVARRLFRGPLGHRAAGSEILVAGRPL